MEKFKGKLKTFKEIILNRKKQISIVAIVLVIVGIATTLIYKNVEQAKMLANNPELAKAMTYDQVQDGEEIVEGTDGNVKFDAFFLRDLNGDGDAESIRGTSRQIGKEDTLYMELNVDTAGYLKDAKITINEDSNFYFQTALPKDNELKDNYIGSNIRTIEFNQLNNGTQKMLTGVVRSGSYTFSTTKNEAIGSNINNYSKVNSVTLTGTYVTEANQEIPITKTVNFNIDWYGTATARVNTAKENTDNELEEAIDEENGVIKLDFVINTEETDYELLLAKNHVEGEIPLFNGYAAERVRYLSGSGKFVYDAENRTFSIDKTAYISSQGEIISKLPQENEYIIRVEYPLEAYQELGEDTIELKIPISSYYEGYNNQSEEFTNPYRSNTENSTIVATYDNPTGNNILFEVELGKIMYDPKRYIVSKNKPLRIYNGISETEKDDTFVVKWRASIGDGIGLPGMIMKETENGIEQVTDKFILNNAEEVSAENVISNIGIAFSGADKILGEKGWIKVYDDESGELIETFTSENWNNYSLGSPYKYNVPTKHVRVETSSIGNDKANFYVYNVKEIDDKKITNEYTRDEFDYIEYIKSSLVGYVGGEYVNSDTNQAHYEAPLSVAKINIKNDTISTQKTEEHAIIEIRTEANSNYNQVQWRNGIFLIRLPDEIVTAEINTVEIENENVILESYELIENENGRFIKIVTSNNIPQTFIIKVDANLSPDPRESTKTTNLQLYATNEDAESYFENEKDIYDVNNNLNVEELVNYDSVSLTIVSPNSLLTNQIATNYDDKGSIIVSPQIADIKPRYAIVDQEEKEQTATIGVQINNNYTNTISDVKIIGRVPFKGNTYVLKGGDLGSTFNTTMTEEGIIIPEELQDQVKIYYSENENADKNILKEENQWKLKENVSNWDNVKSFLIDFCEYVIPTGKEYIFNYTIKLPKGLKFNEVAYSQHGVYFNLDTNEGKYETEVESNKLGLRIAEKFDLELTKYHIGKDKLVPGATYSVTDIKTGESKTAVTTNGGKLNINNLYVEKEYELKELKSPENYGLNREVIKFITHVDEYGNLTVEKTQGITKGEIQVQKIENENYVIKINVEDEVKANIKIIKKEKGTDIPVKAARFKVTGLGFEDGKYISTNTNGELIFTGLEINQEYLLEEVRAEGYYLEDPIKFKIVNNDGTYEFEQIADDSAQGVILEEKMEEEDGIPIAALTIENEKIATYNLEIIKTSNTTEAVLSNDILTAKAEAGISNSKTKLLEGAIFKLYKGNEEVGTYTTDVNGRINIQGLYQYNPNNSENQTYTLKEIVAPEGYTKSLDRTFKVQEENGTLVLINENGTQEKYTVEGNTVKLIIENNPVFKLVKKDKETQQPISNVKFAIYSIDGENEEPAKNTNGEIIGNREIIDEKEYYTVTTNEEGILTANLKEGLYKAIEISAPDNYEINNSEYYFGIGQSSNVENTFEIDEFINVGEVDLEEEIYGYTFVEKVKATSDGGIVAGGTFEGSVKIGDNVISSLQDTGVFIAKYDAYGDASWGKALTTTGGVYVKNIIETRDGKFIVNVDFAKNITIDGEQISTDDTTSLLIKYSANGDVEWKKCFQQENSIIEVTSIAIDNNNNIIIGGQFAYNLTIGESTIESPYGMSGFIASYDESGEAQWCERIGEVPTEELYSQSWINTICFTANNTIFVGGYCLGQIKLDDTVIGNPIDGSISNYTGIIIEYDLNRNAKWSTSLKGTGNVIPKEITEMDDKSIIVAGEFTGNIELEDYVLNCKGSGAIFILKYNQKKQIEFAKEISGNGQEMISSITKTQDGGFAIVGNSYSSELTVGEINIDRTHWTSVAYGIVMKFNSDGELLYYDMPTLYLYEKSITENTKGELMVGGYIMGYTLAGGELVIPEYSYQGVIAKYKNTMQEYTPKLVNLEAVNSSYIWSTAATSDGGYVAGGYFNGNIDIGDVHLSTSDTAGMLIKYNAKDEAEWAIKLEGAVYETIEIADGNIIVQYANNSCYTIAKISEDGGIIWTKDLPSDMGITTSYSRGMSATSDGGFVFGGFFEETININDKKITSNGSDDGIVGKFNKDGEIEWVNSYGTDESEAIYSIAGTSDGGAVVVGSISKDLVIGNYKISCKNLSDYNDVVIIKYDKDGNVKWAKQDAYSGMPYSIIELKDGGIVLVGYYEEYLIPEGELSSLGTTGFMTKLDENGNLLWKKSISSYPELFLFSSCASEDGGFYVSGQFYGEVMAENYQVSTNLDIFKPFIGKYDSNGEVEWIKGIGTSSNSYDMYSHYKLSEIANGEVVIPGYMYGNFSEDEIEINVEGSAGVVGRVKADKGIPEVEELVVENTAKKFNITTDIKEIDGIKGGTISGEDESPYEIVKYGESSTKEIEIKPDKDYEIISVTINGNEYPFEVDDLGICKIPLFDEVMENKHIVAMFALKSNKLTINKVDSETKEPIEGVTFRIDEIEQREDPNEENVIGQIVNNGKTYLALDYNNEITNQVLGEMTNNGTYYFEENSSGQYISNNRWENSTTANSYVKIDLTEFSGEYAVLVNAKIESEEDCDFGYATITNSTAVPSYSTSEGRFIYTSGFKTAGYTSQVLQGGKVYYLHFGYYKNGSVTGGNDRFTINSIKVYEKTGTVTYSFVENNNKYESNNQGVNDTTSYSYIPIDLTGLTGKYNLNINAEISSESSDDYGYATIKTTSDRVEYNDSEGRFIYISGIQEARDYTTVLQGGQMYYLHLGYYKDEANGNGEDKFTINDINLELNDTELYYTIVTTNSKGQAITQLPFSKYKITEINIPKGYENIKPIEIDFSVDSEKEITIENTKKPQVVVHHYLKNDDGSYTTTPVAEDELLEGKKGEKYTTSPKLDLEDYELEKNEEGDYVVPDNATGAYESGKIIEVTYYYEEKEIPLTVHHYIEGTEEKVPLKDGGVAEDVTDSGKEGETYQTNVIDDSLLSDDYELVETPENAEGTYSGREVIVTYYYKKVEREVTINKHSEDGKTPLEGVTFEIVSKETPDEVIGTYTTNEKGKISVTLEAGEYIARETEVLEGYDMPENNETEFSVTKEDELVTLNITNTKTKGTVIVHHYIEGTKTQVPSNEGGVVEDIVQTGNIGDIYATKEAENVAQNYDFVSTQGETSGEYIEGTTEVIYYYRIKDPTIENSEITKESSTEKVINENQTIDYTIKYKTTVNTYIGNATVTIVDYLPYEINEELSNIASGTYNAESKTITWTETIPYIDTYADGPKEINITKEIEIVFKNADTTVNSIQNRIGGKINLETPEKEEIAEEGTSTIPADYIVDIPVEKVWDDAENNTHRPESVTISLTADGEIVSEKTAVLNAESGWKTTFENLPKYTEAGEEIVYSVVEKETNSGDLEYYDEAKVENIGGTIKVTNSYKDLNSNIESNITKTGTGEITHSIDEVNYTITYNATVDEYIGEGRVTIVDYLPYAIDEGKSDIANGTYDSEAKTITWVEELGHINTYEEGQKEINITKEIKVVFNGLDASQATMTNKVTGKLDLDETEVEDTTEGGQDTQINILGNVVAKYLEEGTEKVLAQEETQEGKVGTDYKTTQKDITGYNFVRAEGQTSGKYIEGTTEVIYYYTIKDPIVESNVTKTSETEVVTSKDQKIPYTINYVATVTDYKGKATVTIVDYLPYEINEELSNIASGTYNAESKTITWTETIPYIDTYADGPKEINITKEIEIVFKNADTTVNSIQNRIGGKINLETPEKEEIAEEETSTIPTDYTVDIPVEKVWSDTEEQQYKRPASVNVVLRNGETTVETKILSEANGWKETFTELPKYDSLGNSINYTVEEQETNSGDLKFYTNSVSGNIENGYMITNTFARPTDTITIIANKVWNDNTEQASRRPESITLVVKNGDEEVQSKVVSNSDLVDGTTNQWSVEFTGLDKYDSEGNEIQYTLEERETNSGDLKFYEVEENNVAVEDNQATIRNNFVKPNDTTEVTVRKEWNDNNNVNGRRPSSIKLQVKNGESVVSEQVVTEGDNWSYTFTDLPKYDSNGKEIVYTASESEVNSGDLKFYTNSGVSGDMTSGYTITNTFIVPDEKISLTVNKVWEDNDIQNDRRPDVVTINVKGEDGSIVATYDLDVAGGETSHTFTDLPKYNSENGKEINYTVEEQEKTEGDLHFYTGVVGNVENTSENSKEVTITNTFKKPDDTTDVLVTKVWEDNNDEAQKRPSSIKLLLKNGSETVGEQEVSGDTDTWQYTFEDVAMYNENGQEIVYSVDEAEVNSGDLQFYNKSVSGLTLTNEFTQDTSTVDIPVTKVWEDNETQESRRPASVRIILKANEIKVREYDLTGTGDTWNYTFEDLPKYDSYNNIINYTVEEAEVNNGDLKFYSSSVDGTTITNTFTRPSDVVSIEVTKNWEDQENVYGKRPISVRINVNNGETIVQTAVVTKDDNWTHTFTNLAKYDENGQEILYTVSEEEVMENDLYYYTGTPSLVENKAGETNVKEAVITNEMTKIPSKVIVKYVDKATGEEISEPKEKEGIIGDPFDVTEDGKEIPGYTLVEEPEEKTGTYTSEVQEKVYYYAKDTRVIVKYLEKDETPEDDSDNKVLSDEIILGGYEGKSYTTNSKVIEGYTLVETKGNLNGTMTREEQVVVYYYAKDTKVIVKYLEKDDTPEVSSDNKVLLPEKTIEGYVGKEYTTTGETVPNYTLVEKTTNYEGTMTEETIIVVYYYAKNTNVTVRYLEKDSTESDSDNRELVPDIVIEGYVGKDYETEQKQISGYTFVEVKGEVSGKMTEEPIEIIYYYAQNTKAKVEHIDRETGEILKEETTNGKVGDLFETHAEDFEGYVLVEEPSEPNIIMDKTGEQVVKYYYAHVSAGVIEKHIDVITGELLESSEHSGNEGDPYDIQSKEFSGYDLVEEDKDGNSMLPENASGTMKRDEVIEVKYYYIKKTTVVVKYVDETTGEEIAEEERIEGHENDEYTTEPEDIEDYNLTKEPDNKKGTMTITKNEDGTYDTEIEVIYYYKKISGGVIENHIDVDTDKKLATEEHEGNVGDEYDIPSRTFEDYDLVIDMLPNNSKGVMTEQEIVVNYYYKKRAKVIVEYIDKQTGEKLDEEEINGHLGDEYKAEEKTFDGYDLIEKPSNGEGEMTEDEAVVKYYYARKAEVEVKYLEKGTDYEVAEGEIISGYVGDKYETEQKDVPYYKFVEKTDNWEGEMTKDKITVIYYYEKEIFNLGVDKWVGSVNVNGISTPAQGINSSDEIYKVDIHRSKADTADIKVTYKIRITNKGELEGTVGKITDIIPSGMSFYQEDNDIYWDNNNGVLTTDDLKDEVIGAGDYKEIEVTLRVNVGSENFGQKDNMVILTELGNPAGYEDIDKEDNNDTSSMILTIATGLDRNDRIVIIGIVQIVLAITIGLLLSYKKKEKHEE